MGERLSHEKCVRGGRLFEPVAAPHPRPLPASVQCAGRGSPVGAWAFHWLSCMDGPWNASALAQMGDGLGSGHVYGLFVRHLRPLALMKFAEIGSPIIPAR